MNKNFIDTMLEALRNSKPHDYSPSTIISEALHAEIKKNMTVQNNCKAVVNSCKGVDRCKGMVREDEPSSKPGPS